MKIKLMLLTALIACLVMPVLAADQVKYYGYINSGGSELKSPDGEIILFDSKAEPIIGESTSTSGHKGQFGGLYVLFDITIKDIKDGGPIKLNIVRDGTNINVTWSIDVENYPELAGTKVDIYVLSGDGTGQYTNQYVNNNWKKIVTADTLANPIPFGLLGTLDAANKKLRLLDQSGVDLASTKKELYFKGLPADTVAWSAEEYLPLVMSVGKVDVVLNPLWNLIAIPFNNQAGIAEAFGTNYELGDEIWYYDPATKFKIVNFGQTNWDNVNAFKISAGQGYWLFLKKLQAPTKTITTLGKVASPQFSKSLVKGFNLIGYPFPAKKGSIDAAGLSGAGIAVGDEMWKWQMGFTVPSYTATGWNNQIVIDPYRGYWFYRKSDIQYLWEQNL